MIPGMRSSMTRDLSFFLVLLFLFVSPSSSYPSSKTEREPQQLDERAQNQFFLTSKWFKLTFSDQLGAAFNISFYNALDDSTLSSKVITVSFNRIEEYSADGTLVQSTANESVPFLYSAGNRTSLVNPVIPYTRAVGNFSNSAGIEFFFEVFDKTETITFATQTLILYGGSIKFSVRVTDWPFLGPDNYLKLFLRSRFFNVIPDLSLVKVDPVTGSVTQISVGSQYPNAPPFAVNFLQLFERDSVPSPTFVEVLPVAVSPFIVYDIATKLTQGADLFYDPDIGVLFDPSDESGGDGGDGSDTLAIAIAVPISVTAAGVVALAVLIGGVVYFVVKKRKHVMRFREASRRATAVQMDVHDEVL